MVKTGKSANVHANNRLLNGVGIGMPTCPECNGYGNKGWLSNGLVIHCTVCRGRGALNDLQLEGYEARKLAELKLRLEELADPSPENLEYVHQKRQRLFDTINAPRLEHQASSWKVWITPEDQKILDEANRLGVSSDDVVQKFRESDERRLEVTAIGLAALLMFGLGIFVKLSMTTSFFPTIMFLFAIAFGIWFVERLISHLSFNQD